MGFNNAATCGGCEADIRASPEPPSKTPTGRISLVDGTANMVFSFTDEREHPSLAGNLGFPVRDAPAGEGGAALQRTRWCAVDIVSPRAERHTQPFARLNRTEARRLQGR